MPVEKSVSSEPMNETLNPIRLDRNNVEAHVTQQDNFLPKMTRRNEVVRSTIVCFESARDGHHRGLNYCH